MILISDERRGCILSHRIVSPWSRSGLMKNLDTLGKKFWNFRSILTIYLIVYKTEEID